MNITEFAQTITAIAGIALIVLGSRRLKQHLRSTVR